MKKFLIMLTMLAMPLSAKAEECFVKCNDTYMAQYIQYENSYKACNTACTEPLNCPAQCMKTLISQTTDLYVKMGSCYKQCPGDNYQLCANVCATLTGYVESLNNAAYSQCYNTYAPTDRNKANSCQSSSNVFGQQLYDGITQCYQDCGN